MAVGLKTSSWDGCNVHGMDEKFMGWLHVVTGNSMGWMNPVVEMRGVVVSGGLTPPNVQESVQI